MSHKWTLGFDANFKFLSDRITTMSQIFLPPKWLEQLCDPYAVLGISVTAGDRQILKRYHTLAKLLHPDRHTKSSNQDQELATAIFSHLINPAYEPIRFG